MAFGEINVKMKKRSIILLAAVVICIIAGILFMTNQPRKYQIRVAIPAGSTEPFIYSDEEICPRGSTFTIYAEEGLRDTEIVLLPVESKEEKIYVPVYITPGMPVKLEAEKGAWYKIGVNVQNPTDENRDVYVLVKNVDVRIAAGTKNDGNFGQGDGGSSPANGGLGQTNGNSGQAGGESESAVRDPEQVNKESTKDEFASQRYDMGDLDGNGEMEYLLISYENDLLEYDAHLSFYFNGESIYEYDDLLRMSPGDAEYIDLDSDGEPEIFFTFEPHVNSLPLIEYAVLKRTENGWKSFEMIHGETMLDNGFPISSRYGEEENTIVISCEGLEKEIVYNFTTYYESRVKNYERADPWYQEILNRYRQFETGDDFGKIAAWGIWDINSGTYEGKNCLIATHGLEGPTEIPPDYDILGEIDIYFNYNEKGLVNILNMEFRERLQ